MNTKSQSRSNNCILVYPIYNLEISKEVSGEIQIERVHFVSRYKIPLIRKRLGFKETVSELNSKWEKQNLPKLFSEAPSYAFIIFRSKNVEENIAAPINKIMEALWILVSSQFNNGRSFIRYFGNPEHKGITTTEFNLFDPERNHTIRNFRRIQTLPYNIDKAWMRYKANHFFPYLLNILNSRIHSDITREWKITIRNAAILAGKSYFSREIYQAFLYNMISIESLLRIDQKDKIFSTMIDRYNALFGWLTKEDPKPWECALKRLYQLRCNFVHDGDTRDINTADVIHSDNVLFNLLFNICRSIKYFPNSQSFTELTKKINARRILGQKIKERPDLRYYDADLSPSTIERIRKENNWP